MAAWITPGRDIACDNCAPLDTAWLAARSVKLFASTVGKGWLDRYSTRCGRTVRPWFKLPCWPRLRCSCAKRMTERLKVLLGIQGVTRLIFCNMTGGLMTGSVPDHWRPFTLQLTLNNMRR